MLTTCLAASAVVPGAPAANADAAPDNVLPGPGRDATPSGRPHCKNAGTNARAAPRTPRSSLADRTSAPQIFRPRTLGAYPRAPPARQLTPPPAARVGLAGNADAARAAAPAHEHWPDNAGSPSRDANAARPARTPHCNNGIADAALETTVHSLSANNADGGHALTLAASNRDDEMTPDPREKQHPARSSLGAKLPLGSEAFCPDAANDFDLSRDPTPALWTGPDRDSGPLRRRY